MAKPIHLTLLLISFSFIVFAIPESQEEQIVRPPAYIGGAYSRYDAVTINQMKRAKRNRATIRQFLDGHNKVRQQLGEPLFRWDKNLTRYARRFASQRALLCDMIHSNGPYGENIYWGSDYFQHTAADAVNAWVSELQDYNVVTNMCAADKMCGHYIQIVWRTSQRLGCARVKCVNGGVYIICCYDPPGNFFDESPFNPAPTADTSPPTNTSPPGQGY